MKGWTKRTKKDRNNKDNSNHSQFCDCELCNADKDEIYEFH